MWRNDKKIKDKDRAIVPCGCYRLTMQEIANFCYHLNPFLFEEPESALGVGLYGGQKQSVEVHGQTFIITLILSCLRSLSLHLVWGVTVGNLLAASGPYKNKKLKGFYPFLFKE